MRHDFYPGTQLGKTSRMVLNILLFASFQDFTMLSSSLAKIPLEMSESEEIERARG
jgi:hypothetical protein